MKKVGRTPVRVLEALEFVRESGKTNMLDYFNVNLLMDYYSNDHWASIWFTKNGKNNYYNVVLTDFSEYIQNVKT